MVIVRFNQWEEFLDEVTVNLPDDRTIRLTMSIRYDGQGIAHLTMVAGFLSRNTIVEFVHYLGLQPLDRNSQRSQEIQSLFDDRKKYFEGLGFSVKSGRYHVPPTLSR